MDIAPPFQVRTTGMIHRDPRHSTPGTKKDDLMLIVIKNGYGWYAQGEKTQRVGPQVIGLIPPENCGTLVADKEHPYDHYYCRFNGAYAIEWGRRIIAERGRWFSLPAHSRLCKLLDQMPSHHREDLPGEMGEAESLLVQVLVAIQGQPEACSRQRLNAEMLQAYFEGHISEPVDLDHMAAHFNLTKTSLCRAVKRVINSSVVQAFERVRIERAKALLRDSRLNVTEIADRIGYRDALYFSRVFKRHTAQSPLNWRKLRRIRQP